MVKDKKSPAFFMSVRFLLTLMAFFGYTLQYMLKINQGIAIVCMVNNTALREIYEKSGGNNSSSISNHTSSCAIQLEHKKGQDGTFVWPKNIQGFILASYFYGYILTQIPGGYLSAKFGGRNVLGSSMLFASLLTIVVPFAARLHFGALLACRFLIGVAHGAFWPAMSSIMVFWAPVKERTIMLGSSTAGAWVGNVVGLFLGGWLCASGFDGGWPSIFYIFGLIGVVWSILFMFLITDSPKAHRFIGENEKEYLIDETKKAVAAKEKGLKTPWKEIFKSKACWATIIAHTCNNWGNYFYLTQLPSYMKNGLMSAIPYVACASFTAVLGIISDRIVQRGILSRRNTRRIFNSIGMLVPMAAVICLSFVKCSTPYLGVLFLTVGLAFNGFFWSAGPLVNINDIAGSYSGIVFGITNTFGTIPGIICPYIVGVITKEVYFSTYFKQTQAEWQVVFIICAVIYFVGAVVFWFFCQSELQPWAVVQTSKSSIQNNDEFLEAKEPTRF